MWQLHGEGIGTLSTKYLRDTTHDLVEELHPLHQNGPGSLKCLYLCDNICRSIYGLDLCGDADRGIHEPDGGRGRVQWIYHCCRLHDGVCSLTLDCINVPTWLSDQRKLDRNPRKIGGIGSILAKSVFKHFDRRARISKT